MPYNRREFIQQSAAAISTFTALPMQKQVHTASFSAAAITTLGRSGIKASRLGLGIGDGRGKLYLEMGQERFTRLIRHALDQGIRYFDMDPSHIHGMLAAALKGVDRSSYTLVTGISRPKKNELSSLIERYLNELKTDYIDGVLIIAVGKDDWAKEFRAYRDTLSEAKEKGYIVSHGVSVHGLDGLKTLIHDPWVEFGLISVNHRGVWMDGPAGQAMEDIDKRDLSVPVIQEIHRAGIGVASMKTFGATGFENTAERMKSLRFIRSIDCVDTMPVRFKTVEELEETVALMESIETRREE